MVESVLHQASGDADKGERVTVPLDLIDSGKEDAPNRGTTGKEAPSRKESRGEPMAPRERGD